MKCMGVYKHGRGGIRTWWLRSSSVANAISVFATLRASTDVRATKSTRLQNSRDRAHQASMFRGVKSFGVHMDVRLIYGLETEFAAGSVFVLSRAVRGL